MHCYPLLQYKNSIYKRYINGKHNTILIDDYAQNIDNKKNNNNNNQNKTKQNKTIKTKNKTNNQTKKLNLSEISLVCQAKNPHTVE